MKRTKRTKLVHEGSYVAEVDVELLEEPEEWSPHLSLEDAYRLDDVRPCVEATWKWRRGTHACSA